MNWEIFLLIWEAAEETDRRSRVSLGSTLSSPGSSGLSPVPQSLTFPTAVLKPQAASALFTKTLFKIVFIKGK